jgi:hypothetical protein
MANPDVSAIASSFVEFGGQVFGKKVVNWNLRAEGIQVRTNVNAPQALTKLSAVGGPQPYRAQDDTSGNGVKYTDRILTAHQSKWDHDFDPEQFRNTYLANAAFSNGNFVQAANEQLAKEYLAKLIEQVLGVGVYNGAGTAVADIADGWLTLIAAAIVASKITPNTSVGAIINTNAVAAVETLVTESVPVWMRQMGFRVYCSYSVFDFYRQDYRKQNGFTFDPVTTGEGQQEYKLDNLNAFLDPQAWMGTSQRLIATIDGNLVFGTDVERIQIAATARRNIIETRAMMPVGCQIQDTDAIFTNDQV